MASIDEEQLDQIVANTQRILGKYVKRPPLTAKLLKRPPFRFVHDAVTVCVREHGFLRGLYAEPELDGDTVRDRDAKIAFLAKLIDALKAVTGKEVKARPNKIIAGLEPAETNLMLQAIGNAIAAKIDTRSYVRAAGAKERSLSNASTKKKRSESINSETRTSRAAKPATKNERKPKADEKKRSARTDAHDEAAKGKRRESNKKKKEAINEATPLEPSPLQAAIEEVESIADDGIMTGALKLAPEEVVNKEESTRAPSDDVEVEESVIKSAAVTEPSIVVEDKPDAVVDVKREVIVKSGVRDRSERPKSARPRSGGGDAAAAMQSQSKRSTIDGEAAGSGKTRGGQQTETAMAPSVVPMRPKTSLRPPSVRPSSARPGAPRLRQQQQDDDDRMYDDAAGTMGKKIAVIIENFDGNRDRADGDNNDEDEETVVVITGGGGGGADEDDANADDPTITMQESKMGVVNDGNNNKGHLVEQILEQIEGNERNDATKKHSSSYGIDWDRDAMKPLVDEIESLRGAVQSLTRSANPLGKLLNRLQEDMDAMQTERMSWIDDRKRTIMEIEKRQKLDEESMRPLRHQLDALSGQIERERADIAAVTSRVIENESRIFELAERLLY